MRELWDHLRQCPVTTAAAMKAAGVTRRMVALAYLDRELLHPGHGVYASPSVEDDPGYHDAVVSLMSGGILFRRTMGMRHGITTDLPPWAEWQIGVNDSAPTKPPCPCRFVRTRWPEAFDVGIDTSIVLGIPVRSTDPARTVVDHYRAWRSPGVPQQHVPESLHGYLSDGGSPDRLTEVASHFGSGVRRRIETALETVLGGPSF